MRNLLIALLIVLQACAVSPVVNGGAEKEILKFQQELNDLYKNPEETPLRGTYLNNFTAHPFFPVDLKYRVTADYERIYDSEPFDMPTSSGRTQKYIAFAQATFMLEGKLYTLFIYQNQRLKDDPEYANHLFLPFYDETNGTETYGGGRYIDLDMPQDNKIIIDFNQAYQPYCAYNLYDYSCPIVPAANRLNIRIPAGVMYDAEDWAH